MGSYSGVIEREVTQRRIWVTIGNMIGEEEKESGTRGETRGDRGDVKGEVGKGREWRKKGEEREER